MAVSDHSPEAVEQRAADLQRSRDVSRSMDHAELFRNAMADSPPAPQPEQPAPAPPPQQPEPQREQPPPAQAAPQQPQERQRDEHGRFLPSTQQPTTQAPVAPAAATQQQPATPATPEEAAMIPSWRLREERERREEVAQQLAYERDARIRYEQQLQAHQRAMQQQQEQVPDMVTDPAGYHSWVMAKVQQQHQEQQANLSFRLHHMHAGDELFFGAWNEMMGRAQRGDNTVVRQVMDSPDPGAFMMDWYRRERNQAKLGQHGDPEIWAEKEYLPQRIKNDPTFRASLQQLINGAAPQQANGQAATATYQVPPSLSRVPGAAANGTGGDMSDPSLFAFAMRSGR